MNYIVFDLEWNQSPDGKKCTNKKIPFEIIEIGAVKLNEEREVTDVFHRIIRPQVYTWIHDSIRDVIHVDYKDLRDGISFPQAAREFLEWCGTDYAFCTWGNQDLTELQRNLKYYDMICLLPGPVFYYDVQKLFSWFHEHKKLRRGLEYAVDTMRIEKGQRFHRAREDAEYTAEIFRRMDRDTVMPYFSVDVFQNPRKRKEELHISYPFYDKYVSREFADKEKIMKDREVTSTRCPLCHFPAKRKIRWFVNNSKSYESISLCQNHGYVKGKIRIRKTDEGAYYAVKTLKNVDEEKAEEIRNKRDSLRKKRALKLSEEKLGK